MRDHLITVILENFADLHVEYLKTSKGSSLMAYLSEIESERKEDWKALAAAEAAVLMAVCIAEALNEDD